MKFTIDRRYWLRGEGGEPSFLYRSDRETHNMCCLGQISEQCGIDKTDLDRLRQPNTFAPITVKERFEETFGNAVMVAPLDVNYYLRDLRAINVLVELMNINDSPQLTDAQRELILTDLIAHFYGHELEFVN